MNATNLFEKIGGEAAVKATVTKMYEKIFEDEELAPFFEQVDIDALRRSQTAFVTVAFGGPNHYSGKTLRAAHKKAVSEGLTEKHFDRVAGHLKEAMEELNVDPTLVKEALAIVAATKPEVLNQ